MPLIKPKPEEKKQEFIDRFMSNKAAQKEYPIREQRLALAYAKWERHGRDV